MLVSDHVFVMIDPGKWYLGLIGCESGNFEEFGLNFVVVASVQTSERCQGLQRVSSNTFSFSLSFTSSSICN